MQKNIEEGKNHSFPTWKTDTRLSHKLIHKQRFFFRGWRSGPQREKKIVWKPQQRRKWDPRDVR